MTETITSSHTPAWSGQFSGPATLYVTGAWGAASAVAVAVRPVNVDGTPVVAGDTAGSVGYTLTPDGEKVVRIEADGRYQLKFAATGADGSTNLTIAAVE